MSESAIRYVEKRGWDVPRSMAFRRAAEQKARAKMKRMAAYSYCTGHSVLSDYYWDMNRNEPVDRGYVKQYYMNSLTKHCKKMSRRKVRRTAEIANGNQYKKVFEFDYTIW